MNRDLRIIGALLEAIRVNRDWFGIQSAEDSGLAPLLRGLSADGLIEERKEGFRLRRGGRVLLSQLAVALGAPASAATRYLRASEFEDFVNSMFRIKGFHARKRLRVISWGRAAEFDVIGVRYGRAVFAECKKWRRKGPLSSICARHANRVRDLGMAVLVKMGYGKSESIKGFPLVVTLIPEVQFAGMNCIAAGIDKFGSVLDRIENGEFDSLATRFSFT